MPDWNFLNPVRPGSETGTAIGPLTNISITNVGSGSNANAVPESPIRNYVLIANPNAVVFYVHPLNGTAGASQPGSIAIAANDHIAWPGNGGQFVPTGAMSVAGSSGMGVTILTG